MTFVLLMVALSLVAGPRLDGFYRSARSYDKRTFRFKVPDDVPLRRMQALVARVVRAIQPGAPPAALVVAARAAGLELVTARDASGDLWVLREPAGRREGDGFYAFRAGGFPLCIQAPHTFFDEGTGEIALALFARLRAAALFVNTVHRHARADAEGYPADVAHAERTMFAAATHGMMDGARWDLVQLHGFGDREDLAAVVKAVVSDGSPARRARTPGERPRMAAAERLRAALAARWGGTDAVRLFGVDAAVLGATTNVEGKAARAAGASFLHVEMSASTRRDLAADITPLAEALEESLGRSRP
jgi:hypothetical protein